VGVVTIPLIGAGEGWVAGPLHRDGWSLTCIMLANTPGAVMERGQFGRETELARVSKVLDGIPSGPVALILGGEAGIGKSTLWLESLSQARARSYRVLSCRPDESEAKFSYAALGDLLEGVVEESLERLPSPQRSALEVALLRADATGLPPDQRAISTALGGSKPMSFQPRSSRPEPIWPKPCGRMAGRAAPLRARRPEDREAKGLGSVFTRSPVTGP